MSLVKGKSVALLAQKIAISEYPIFTDIDFFRHNIANWLIHGSAHIYNTVTENITVGM